MHITCSFLVKIQNKFFTRIHLTLPHTNFALQSNQTKPKGMVYCYFRSLPPVMRVMDSINATFAGMVTRRQDGRRYGQ